MTILQTKLEALLFVAAKPIAVKDLVGLVESTQEAIVKALDDLMKTYEEEKRGLRLIKEGKSYQLVTAPEVAGLIKDFIKDESMGELSRPSLEALTIIAYRGPISKLDLDRIRGVNCALILRNLLLHGLIEAKADSKKKETYYSVTLDFIRFLGISDISQLPDYKKLRQHETLERMLETEKPTL